MPGSRSRWFLAVVLLVACPGAMLGAEPVCPERQSDSQARLWEAILLLTAPGGSEQAQATLRQAGREGFSLLLQVVRLTGAQLESPKPWPVPPRTGAGSVSPMVSLSMKPHDLGGRAAELAQAWVKEDPKLRRELLRHPGVLERTLALYALADDPKALQPELDRIAQTREPELQKVGEILEHSLRVNQAMRQAQGPKGVPVAAPPEGASASRDPQVPGSDLFRQEYVRLHAQGLLQVSGIHTSPGTDLIIHLGSTPAMNRVDLNPRAAVAFYQGSAQLGRFDFQLLTPILRKPLLPREVRTQAAALLARDFKRYENKDQDEIAAVVVNAGFPISHRLPADPGRQLRREEIREAAVRQGSAEARANAERELQCRDDLSDVGIIALLGFLGTREAADEAAWIAERCPKGRQGATAALVRLRDPRALKWLGFVFANWGVGSSELERAIEENYTPELAAALKKTAESSPRAKQLCERMEKQKGASPR